jgi:hypothetical protein
VTGLSEKYLFKISKYLATGRLNRLLRTICITLCIPSFGHELNLRVRGSRERPSVSRPRRRQTAAKHRDNRDRVTTPLLYGQIAHLTDHWSAESKLLEEEKLNTLSYREFFSQ